mmetsp:Transcript_13781/g.30518  ORF Transcript_13781/g.30518 Transcript_13781/m.30518 type:complete len:240 (+) Transcript_13781:1613-2332(+)
MPDFWRTESISRMPSRSMSEVSRSLRGHMSATFGSHTSPSLWKGMAAASWNAPEISSNRPLRRYRPSLPGGSTCSTPSWKRSMAWHGMPCPSTTVLPRLWRRRTCSRCMVFWCGRRPSSSVRPEPERSMIRPLRICHRIESKTPAFATPRWKPCLGRWTGRAAFTSTHRSSATHDGKKSFGKSGAALKCSMAMRIRSETCCESSEAFRPCSPRFTSTRQTLPRRQVRLCWIRWLLQRSR